MIRFIILLLLCGSSFAMTLDEKLNLVKKIYSLEAKNCSDIIEKDASKDDVRLGELLFKSKLLSGNNNIACVNCHLDEFHAGDGLPLAIGAGGEGKGTDRLYHGKGTIVARNAISLFGTGLAKNKEFFWDGKVSEDAKGNRYSPIGKELSDKFDNTLAIAAILPITERDELVGSSSIFSPNEIRNAVNYNYYDDKFQAVSEKITSRISELDSSDELKQLINSRKINNFNLVHVGNFLSKFIAHNFKCSESKFDKYLMGQNKVLTDSEKRGALLFYGKGRCASCHTGNLFSDEKYHSLGIYQGDFGPHPRHRDIGRGGVTFRLEDKFKFKTPRLIEVSKTAPYGHNGAYKTLRDITVQHFNPIMSILKSQDVNEFSAVSPTLDSRDEVLSTIRIENDNHLNDIVAFLKTL